jgi:hypothetical protein
MVENGIGERNEKVYGSRLRWDDRVPNKKYVPSF